LGSAPPDPPDKFASCYGGLPSAVQSRHLVGEVAARLKEATEKVESATSAAEAGLENRPLIAAWKRYGHPKTEFFGTL